MTCPLDCEMNQLTRVENSWNAELTVMLTDNMESPLGRLRETAPLIELPDTKLGT